MTIETIKISQLKRAFNKQSLAAKYAEVGGLALGLGGLLFVGTLSGVIGVVLGAAGGFVWGTKRTLERGF